MPSAGFLCEATIAANRPQETLGRANGCAAQPALLTVELDDPHLARARDLDTEIAERALIEVLLDRPDAAPRHSM